MTFFPVQNGFRVIKDRTMR